MARRAAQPRSRALIVSPTVRVVLHGRLRKQFGPEFRLGVTTPTAAIRALTALKPGFREALAEGQYRVRRGKFRKGIDLPPEGLILRLTPGGEMHIIPVAKGAKSGMGLGKIIAGGVLLGAAFLTAGLSSAGFATTIFGSFTAGNLALAGGALLLSGIISVLSPQPKTYRQEQSWIIQGLSNAVSQGVPVPICYGAIRVGSIVISIGYTAADYTPEYYVPPRPEDYPASYGGLTPWGIATILSGSSDDMTAGTGSTSVGPGTSAPTTIPYPKATGGGGSGKGGPVAGGTVIENDTLFSNATVQIIDVLGEGPIGGLQNGGQSIYFDGTPLQADDNTFNFFGVTWIICLGYPDQDPVPGFPASQNSAEINLQVKQATPIVQRITGVAATAAQVTMEIPAAYSVDQHTGDVSTVQIQYMIECRPSQLAEPGFTGSWVTMVQVNLAAAKASSPYQKSHRFDLDTSNDADTWDIRVTRITPDSDDTTYLQNDTYWQLLDTIVDHQLMYSNTAYIALQIDSQAFGGTSIPTRTYDIFGRTIAVPANYSIAGPSTDDANARTYATTGVGTSGGTWDLASWQLLPSDNPAFILFDLLLNSRYGVGLNQAALEGVKSELYVIAQYADAMISDGFGGQETRYSVNVSINTQDDAYRVIQLVASAMRAMTYWGAGQVFVSADMPLSVAKLANQTNVVDGDFEYSGTSLKTRPNLVRVSYLDSTNRYLQTVEPVSNAQDIAVRGVVPTDVVGWGVTTRGRAHRLGAWIMYTAAYQTETVTYKGGFYHLDTRPGMIVGISDPAYAGTRMGGRLRSGTIPVGQNLIASSVAPTFEVTSPNLVSGTSGVEALVAGVQVYVHTSESTTLDCGHIGITAAAGTYYVSCYVWIAVATGITSVSLATNATIDPSERIILSSDGRALTDPDGSVVSFSTDSPPSNVANLGILGGWQRLSFVAILSASGTLTAQLDIAGTGTGQEVYSTAWSIDPTGLNPFIATQGSVPVVQQLLLDSLFVEDGSSAYTVSVVMPDGTTDNNVPITGFVNSGTSPAYTIVQLSEPLSQVPSANAEWIITSTLLAPRQFQVLSAGEQQEGIYTITAVNYNIDKFAIVEEGLNFVAPVYSNLPALLVAALPAPTNISVMDYITGVGVTQQIVVTVSFTTPTDPRIGSYQIYASATGFYMVYSSQVGALDITGLQAGLSFTFGVRSVAAGGQTSAWTVSDPITIDGSIAAPIAPTGLTALGGTRQMSVNWIAIPNRRDILQYDIYRGSTAEAGPGAGATLLASVTATSYLDGDTVNLAPNTTWYYWVQAIAMGTPTVPGAFAGPAAGTTTLLIADDLAEGILTAASFAAGLQAVQIIANLNTITDISGVAVPIGGFVVNQVDSQLYIRVTEGTSGALGDLGDYLYAINLAATAGQIVTAQLSANSVTTATLAAGAVTAAQIAVGTLTANLLASTFQLTESAQIGTAVIQSANIADLTVGTSNIADSAISDVGDAIGDGTASVTLTTPGTPCIILGILLQNNSFPSSDTFTLSRDGTTLQSYTPQLIDSGSDPWPIPVLYLDSPSSGSHTWTLSTTHGYTGADVTLIVISLKK